ncbi:MAG TPA: hypothetical protein VM266_00385 [Solirubrobacteraceae bacterium]|nr:hypothetical protein [Solirubrobacteraceae bacterium]
MEHVAGGIFELIWRFTREVGLALAVVAFGTGALSGMLMAGDLVVERGVAPLVVAPMACTAVAGVAGGRGPLHVTLAALVAGLTTFTVGALVAILSLF